MREFHLKIATPDGPVFDGNAESLLVRTDSGDVEIMAGHADYFAPVGVGISKVKANGNVKIASCSGGFVSVFGGEVNLACTTFEFADSIDIARARDAKERAEETISKSNDDKIIKIAKAKLMRAITRINAAELK